MRARHLSSLLLVAAAACGDGDGSDGVNSLTLTADEPAGGNCQYGGVAISSGQDRNGNGKLDEAEEPTVRYVCNGAGGSNGANGDGGISAFQPVVNTSAAPANECPAGGVQITVGFDRNSDGDISDPGETNGEPRYLCNGSGGQLTAAASEPAGSNCPAGGVAISSGVDTNQNGKLDPAEITAGATTYACTDPTLVNGAQPLVVSSAPKDAYISSGVTTPAVGTTVELRTASITAPTGGIVLAIATTSAYCGNGDSSTGPLASNCASPATFPTVANFTIVQQGVGAELGSSGTPSLLFLSSGAEASITTTEAFTVPAGTHTFRALGLAGIDSAGGTIPASTNAHVLFGPAELSLIFLPN